MYALLLQVLLWLLLIFVVYQLLLKVIPKNYLTVLGGFFIFAIIVLAFFYPNERIISGAWSILSFPLRPVGATILLLSIALNQGLKQRNFVVAALLILLISSMPILANQLAQALELGEVRGSRVTDVTAPANQTAGAIVLLDRGLTRANTSFQGQGQLLDTTAQLYREQVNLGSQPIVIVSAGLRGEANSITNSLTQIGVPRSQIVIESRSEDLRTSAEQVRSILRSRGVGNTRVILVTSGINSRRARLTYSGAGINVIARPTNFVGFGSRAQLRQGIGVESFIPSVEALSITTRIIDEFFTSLYYYLRGWLPGNIF
jgi:uncharacterized SAM-binding protein YcdF (DUF218 family)